MDQVLLRAADAHVQAGQRLQQAEPRLLQEVIGLFAGSTGVVGSHLREPRAQRIDHHAGGVRVPRARALKQGIHCWSLLESGIRMQARAPTYR